MGFLRLLWNMGSPAVNQQTDTNRNLIKKSKILNKAHKCHLFSFSAWNYSMNCSNKFDCSCIFVAEFCDSSHPYRQSCAGSVCVSNCLDFLKYSSKVWLGDSAGLKLNLMRKTLIPCKGLALIYQPRQCLERGSTPSVDFWNKLFPG